MSYCVFIFCFVVYYMLYVSLFAKIRKRFIANTPACIDIDFSLFNKKLVMLSKKNIKDSKMGYFVYLSKNKIQ